MLSKYSNLTQEEIKIEYEKLKLKVEEINELSYSVNKEIEILRILCNHINQKHQTEYLFGGGAGKLVSICIDCGKTFDISRGLGGII